MDHIVANGKVEHRQPAKDLRYGLSKLDAKALEVLWPTFIFPGLLRIKEKDKHSGHWIPEHVRSLIDRGHLGQLFCECHLIVPVSDTKPVGFVVLRLYNDEFINVPDTLFVWLTYCIDPRALKYILPLGEKRAREIGVTYVQGITSRMGWLRRLKRYGYEMHQMIIRKQVLP